MLINRFINPPCQYAPYIKLSRTKTELQAWELCYTDGMKIADGELRQILLHDLKLPAETVRELVADSRQSNVRLLQTAIKAGATSEETIAKAHAKRIGVPFISLATQSTPNKTVLRLPRQIAMRYQVVCFDETSTSVKIAMADPRNEQARKAIRHYCGKTVRRYLATTKDLRSVMQVYRKLDTAPLPLSTRELLMTLVEQAARNGSQDIHFDPQNNDLLIKRRVGNRLQTMSTLPLYRYAGLLSWCKVQIGSDVSDTERPHHGRFALHVDGELHDIAVNTIPVIDGEKMVLRLVPPASSVPALATIGYTAAEVDGLQALIQDGSGLIIVAGNAAAAIPTTLASLALEASKQPHTAVSSIEEPIRYRLPVVSQIEITHALPLEDIAASVITQNPQVIITSNLGKGAVAEQFVDFALSRHLVISGLYGTSLKSVVNNLRRYPMAPALLAASLRLIIIQHLVPTLCKNCRIPFKPVGPLKTVLAKQFSFTDTAALYRQGPGCHACHKGLADQILVPEWLAVTPELQQLLASGADEQATDDYIIGHGTLAKRLGTLASKGLISVDQAVALLV
jgi:type II secretory ATPase GspE/PulE/Tfp pilus assembly ATPase PilB-like protein